MDTKLRTLSEIIGKTHGIKFKISPPINAKRIADKTESDSDISSVSVKEESITKDSLFIVKIPLIIDNELPASIKGISNNQLFSSFIKFCSLA